MMQLAYTLGRILVPILFIVLGVGKFLGIDDLARALTGYVPLPADLDGYLGGIPRYVALGYLVAAIETICGIVVLVGFMARWGALVLVVYTACTIIFVNQFWAMDGIAAAAHRLAALQNLSILGALLLIVAGDSGRNARDRQPVT